MLKQDAQEPLEGLQEEPGQDDGLPAGIAVSDAVPSTTVGTAEGASVDMAASVLDVGEGAGGMPPPPTAGVQSPDDSTEQGSHDGGDDLDEGGEEEGEEGDGGAVQGEGLDDLDDEEEEGGEEGDGGAEEAEVRQDAGQLAVEALRLHSTLSAALQDSGVLAMAVEAFPAVLARRAAAATQVQRIQFSI